MAGRLTNYATYLTSSLVGVMKAARPDVVLTMTDPPVVAAAAAAASAARRVPFVYVTQDVFPEVGVVLGKIRSPALVRSLSAEGGDAFARAIMTTDTVDKQDRKSVV
jgi:N-acetylglutamate synthase/N-acetylornithine aminotransferase